MTLTQCSYVIVDWGTTNFRAFAMSNTNELLATKELNLGLLQVEDRKFAESLEQVFNGWLPNYQEVPVYMAGMVGSMKGWVNVDYAKAPANSVALANGVYQFTLPWGANATIIPGVSHEYEHNKFDVMRGEEVQIIGLCDLIDKPDFYAIFPGTHSKHVNVSNSYIAEFSSYLTGEMYDVLIKNSLLGKGLSESIGDENAFLKGVEDGQTGEFTNRIFLAWTHRLFAQLEEKQVPDYLSGLLIGFELKNISHNHVYIVGGSHLSNLYQKAANSLNIDSTLCNGNDCFLSGMKQLIKELN